jgi:hypothetical protein
MWEDFRALNRQVIRVWRSAIEQEERGMSEYDHHGKRRSDDDETPEVEAHRHFRKRGEDGPSPAEVDRHWKKRTDGENDDDSPDVEAHRFRHR